MSCDIISYDETSISRTNDRSILLVYFVDFTKEWVDTYFRLDSGDCENLYEV